MKITDAVVCVFAAFAFMFLVAVTGLTTHESRMKDIEKSGELMKACLQTERTAADCRIAAYGSDNDHDD
jgi:hypothetical protein